ncbi:MAG: beta-propeller fold lactonase family protein [Leptolyngbya sp. SIO4C1]|nr:beta-propeller fold lactonase family protein [Leptolyngbya sp. SIO4C1]
MTSQNIKINPKQGQIAVANRGSGSLSILNETTGSVIGTVDLPAGQDNTPGDPTYITYLNSQDEVAVADRANSQVVFFDRTTYSVTGSVETGAGNFHMWATPKENQLWVVNDIDNALTVIDPNTKTEIERIHLPETLISPNAKPHDVVLDSSGLYAYVTVSQADNPDADLLLKIDTQTFDIVQSAEIGKDAHVSLTAENNLLYVLSQDSDRIDIFDRRENTLEQVGSLDQPGAHGVIAAPDGQFLYTTNIAGGGESGLFVIDTVSNQIVGDLEGVNTPFSTPHNVAVTNDGERLFVTHSGADATAVSVYSLDDPTLPVWQSSVNVQGMNPFGLASVASSHEGLFVCGEIDDLLKAGRGNDTVFGGGGNDDLRGQGGNDKLIGEVGDDTLRGNSGHDVLIGDLGSDVLMGGHGDDLLIGAQVTSLTPGQGEVDTYRGGKGADTFVLGDALSVHYDDGDALSMGFADYGLIKDFQLEQDVIRLHGSADRYELGSVQGDTAIFYQAADQAAELIGIIRNVTGLELTSSAFEYATV